MISSNSRTPYISLTNPFFGNACHLQYSAKYTSNSNHNNGWSTGIVKQL